MNLQDLGLIHNYSLHTASTLHSDLAIKAMMRVNVPELGLEYEFVMRGILAISALHLAHLRPKRREYYLAQAAHHQEIGLREATSLLPYLNEENCSAIYIFSAFTL